MTSIVVSRRDGILRAPDGTKYRVARGKTLANAAHPAVEAHPGDWQPIEITLDVEGAGMLTPGGDPATAEVPVSHAQVEHFENDVAELEETLASRDAELTRLAEGLAVLGFPTPAEEDRTPGWLVDLVLDELGAGRSAPLKEGGVIAPPKGPRRRAVPALPAAGIDD